MATRKPPRTAAGTRQVRLKRTPAFRAGIATRARVLGSEYVDRSLANADALTAPFQQIATEYAWGTVWQRKGLGLRDRSLATVAMCIALNRPDELRIHIRGALNNGMTRGEIGEVILHAFLYCGGPAALDAYKVAREVFAQRSAPRTKGTKGTKGTRGTKGTKGTPARTRAAGRRGTPVGPTAKRTAGKRA